MHNARSLILNSVQRRSVQLIAANMAVVLPTVLLGRPPDKQVHMFGTSVTKKCQIYFLTSNSTVVVLQCSSAWVSGLMQSMWKMQQVDSYSCM